MDGVLIHDGASLVFKTILLFFSALTLCIAYSYRKISGLRIFEFSILVLVVCLGLCLLVSAFDLIALYMALELQSLCRYALAALRRSSIYSTEAGLKYFVLGAVSSGLRRFGMSLIYGFTGTSQFGDLARILSAGEIPLTLSVGVAITVIALFFKVGVVPFHQ
jgi:NADH-quinone oxidoreductase subunit N